ncbi:hypothetical protein LTR53_014723, partial [Teratosphaeriaceae sp. CCFEE 6253]
LGTQARIIAEMAPLLNLHAAQGLRKKANLLSLPPELRARIHHFAIPRSAFCIDGVRTRSKDLRSSHWNLNPHERPLALTCRQIRHTLLPVCYARSTFSRHMGPNAAYLRSLLAAFEASLGEHARSLRNITLTRKLEPDCRPYPARGSRWYLKNPRARNHVVADDAAGGGRGAVRADFRRARACWAIHDA